MAEHKDTSKHPDGNPIVLGEREVQVLKNLIPFSDRADLYCSLLGFRPDKLVLLAVEGKVGQLVGDQGLKPPLEDRDVLDP